MASATTKHSYTIPCASTFRDAAEALAAQRKVNVGDLARSVLLVMPDDVIAAYPDPGDPPPGDREIVVLKSGPAEGRPWRRKPRLQVRMAPGYEVVFVRRALAIALAMERGEVAVRLIDPKQPVPKPTPPEPVKPEPPKPEPKPHVDLPAMTEELERLRAIVSVLCFEPLPQGVNSKDEALHILGFPPGTAPDQKTIRAKFRMLATIHHPDSAHGNHQRMSQLNAAMDVLKY